MRRSELMRRLRQIAQEKGAEMSQVEGGRHTKILFNGRLVTTVARHREIAEHTSRAIVRDADEWTP